MDSAIDTADPGFISGLGELAEATQHSRQGIGGQNELKLIAAGKLGKDLGRCSAKCTVAGGIFGKGRGRNQRNPARIELSGRVAISIRLADGGDWTPKVVCEFNVPTNDGGIGQGDVECGEETRA